MKIERLRNKVKIILEYPTKSEPKFEMLNPQDLDQIIVNVFLKDKRRIAHEDIESISIKAREVN